MAYRATQVSHLFRLNGEQFFQNLRYLTHDDQGRIHRQSMSQTLIDSVAELDDMSFPENMTFPPGLSDEERARKRAEERVAGVVPRKRGRKPKVLA